MNRNWDQGASKDETIRLLTDTIVKAREKLGLRSNADVARMLHLDRGNMTHIMKGQRNMNVMRWLRLFTIIHGDTGKALRAALRIPNLSPADRETIKAMIEGLEDHRPR